MQRLPNQFQDPEYQIQLLFLLENRKSVHPLYRLKTNFLPEYRSVPKYQIGVDVWLLN